MKAFGAAPLLLTLAKVLAIQGVSFYYDVDKYRFVSYRNVWHDDVGNHLSYSVDGGINEDLARAGCANFCAVDSNCDAFYLEEKPGIGNCHLVDETGFPRTVGHGWASNKRYYVKESISPAVSNIPIDDSLIQPCDLDEAVLDPILDAECSPGQALTYFNCSSTLASYPETVGLVKDAACPGEDRLLQCELNNREVLSNIIEFKKEIFENAFVKAASQPMGMIANVEPFQWVKMEFKSAKRVKRAILRTTRNGNEHIRTGEFVVYQGGLSESVAFDFAFVETCALLVDFSLTGTPLAASATAVELKPDTWFGYDYHGFKLDLFVTEP